MLDTLGGENLSDDSNAAKRLHINKKEEGGDHEGMRH